MKTRNLKRLLSWLLCLSMVTGLLPVTALAADQPAITTETLADATVGKEYTAQLAATASDQNGTLTWSSEDLPDWLALTDNLDGTAALTGTPAQAGEVTFTVKVTETIPAPTEETDTAEPTGGTEPAEGNETVEPAEPTVLTALREYTLTVAEAVSEPVSEPVNEPVSEPVSEPVNEPVNEPVSEPISEPVNEPVSNDPLTAGDTDGGSTRGSEDTCSIAVYNDYLTTPGGGIGYPTEAEITEFAMGDTIYILASDFSPAFSTLGYDAFQLISLGLRPAADTSGYGTIVWTSENGGSAAGNADTNKLSSYGLPLSVSGGSLSDGEYRFVLYIWNGLSFSDGGGGAETVYVSTNTITIGQSAGTGGSSGHPTILTTALPSPFLGESYEQTLQASPGKGGTLSWSVTAGSLPAGLNLSSTGTLSGTPAAAGNTTFTVTVTEKDSDTQEVLGTAAQSFTMEVARRLTITTEDLPVAARGAYYSAALEANLDGVLWSKLGESPDWLTLYSDGRLSGNCPEDAEDSYTITAVARVGTQTVEKEFTISVKDLFTFTVSGIAPAAAGQTCYLKAEQGSNTVTLWSGTCEENLSIPVSSRYSGTQVSNVRLFTSLYPSGEVTLAFHTESVTLTEGSNAALTLDSNAIVILPEIQHEYGDNVTAYYKNAKGYSLYGGDLAAGSETYTLAVKVSASSGDFTRQYATDQPIFTVDGVETGTYDPAQDSGKEIALTYHKWEDIAVPVTLINSEDGEIADLSGGKLSVSQRVGTFNYTDWADITYDEATETNTATVKLYPDVDASAALSIASSAYYLTTEEIEGSEISSGSVTLSYQKNKVSSASILVTPKFARNDEALISYAKELPSPYFFPSITYDSNTWQASRLDIGALAEGTASNIRVFDTQQLNAINAMVETGGSYTLSWGDSGGLIAGTTDSLTWNQGELVTQAEVQFDLRGGLLLDLTYDGIDRQAAYAWWYRKPAADAPEGTLGTWIRYNNIYYVQEHDTYAIPCPGEEGTYHFLLLPAQALAPTGMTWEKALEVYDSEMPRFENITVTNNQVTKKTFTVTKSDFTASMYLTQPNSTLSGPEQYSSLNDVLTFTGHIELDPGVEGTMSVLRIDAAGTDSGGRVATQISSVVVDGKSYPYTKIELSGGTVNKDKLVSKQFETYYQITFSKPVQLPCDISIYGVPMRTTSDCVLDVSAQVTVNGSQSWQPVGEATVKAPAISASMGLYTSGGEVSAYLSLPQGEKVDVYDGDVLVLSNVGGGAVKIPLSGTAQGRATAHNLTFRSRGSDSQPLSLSQTVIHATGLPTLTDQYLNVRYGSSFVRAYRNQIYSYLSNTPPTFSLTCTIENADNLLGNVVFAVTRLDGTVSYMNTTRSGNNFTTAGFTGSPVIAATALFEPDWDKINKILQGEMDPVPANSPIENMGISANFTETVVIPYEEHNVQFPDPSSEDKLTDKEFAEMKEKFKELQDDVVDIYKKYGGQAGFYIIDIGPDQFVPAGEMIEGLDTRYISQGETGTTTMTRPLTPEQLQGELGSGDWSRYTFTEPGESGGGETTGMEIYTQSVSTESGVDATITIATDGTNTVEFATAQGTGTGTNSYTLPESGTFSSCTEGGFSFTTFESDGMSVFTNVCGDVAAGSGLVKDITSLVTGAEASGVFAPLEKGLGAYTFAKDMMDGMSNELTLANLLNEPRKWLSSPCAQKLPQAFKDNMQRQIDNFIKDVRDAEGWNMTVTGANYLLGAGGLAGMFSNPFTATLSVIGGAASWCAGKISGMKLDNVQKQATLLKDTIDLKIQQMARLSNDPDCMNKRGDRHNYAVCIDPSGIVYEAVLSNPVEGATVKLYTDDTGYVPEYSENVDGLTAMVDDNGNPVRPSNAGDASGANLTTPAENTTIPGDPVQTTGADGKFQWNVQQGLWYVTAEKDCYEPGDSGNDIAAVVNAGGINWLPVLPEQLNVNIPLVSYEAPDAEVEYRPDGVYIQFSKYMDDTTLTTGNFTLKSGGQEISFTVKALDREQAPANIDYSGTAPWYASQIKLEANLTNGDEVSLTIGQNVKTYAGIAWGGTEALTGTVAEAATVDAPTFSRPGGSVPYGTTITLEDIPEGAAVYYTTDGTTPSAENGTRYYGEEILLTADMTITAVAVKLGNSSSVVQEVFTVTMPANAIIGDPDNQPGDSNLPVTPVNPGGGADDSSGEYLVNAGKTDGGKVNVNPGWADEGDTVTLTVTPNGGYELSKLTVTDAQGNEMKLSTKDGVKYTFIMPDSRVTVKAVFSPIATAPVNPFTDVSQSDYYYSAVLWAVANGVTAGTSATTFGPNVTVTRAQAMTFLWRAYGSPKVAGANPFTDVSTSDYYYDAVLWAVKNGVTGGTSATTFSPNAPVTRAQAMTFQWRAAGSPAAAGGSSFDDVAADAYYAQAVTWAVADGITAGTGGSSFSPDAPVTRAQAMTFLWKELA